MTMLNAARVWISKPDMTAYNYQIPTKRQTGVLQLDFPNVHLVNVVLHGAMPTTIFNATQGCNIGRMLQSFETMSQE